jgi:tetratricopeptide (TPR) repeat protein
LNSEAENTLINIKKIEPGFDPDRESRKSVILIPEKIKPYIEKAEKLRKAGKISESLKTLMEANKIRETAYANLLIGKLLLSQKNITALSYLEKANREIKDDPSLIFNLCLTYLIKKDIINAREKMDEFIKLEGENNPRSLQLKELYWKSTDKTYKK